MQVKKVVRRFRLRDEYAHGDKVVSLGVYSEEGPPRVNLSRKQPIIEGDGYAQYLTSGYIVEIDPRVEMVDVPDVEASPQRSPRCFELTPAARQGGKQYRIGGYGAGDPLPVTLSAAHPRVEGDGYAQYLPLGFLQEVMSVDALKRSAKALLNGTGKLPTVQQTPLERELTRVDVAPAPAPAFEPTPIEADVIEEELPPSDDLLKMSRVELEELAKRRGVWSQVPATGKGDYRTREDLLRFFGLDVADPIEEEAPSLPRPTQLKKMSKDELLSLALKLDLLDTIPKSGKDGGHTANDLSTFLVNHVQQLEADGELDD